MPHCPFFIISSGKCTSFPCSLSQQSDLLSSSCFPGISRLRSMYHFRWWSEHYLVVSHPPSVLVEPAHSFPQKTKFLVGQVAVPIYSLFCIGCANVCCICLPVFLFLGRLIDSSFRANRAIEGAITSHETMVTDSLKDWYMCQVVLGSVLMSAVEIVLMARGEHFFPALLVSLVSQHWTVYALYKKNIWVGMLFIGLIVAEMISVVVGIVLNRPGREFRASSLLLKSPTSYVYFGWAYYNLITPSCLTVDSV